EENHGAAGRGKGILDRPTQMTDMRHRDDWRWDLVIQPDAPDLVMRPELIPRNSRKFPICRADGEQRTPARSSVAPVLAACWRTPSTRHRSGARTSPRSA